jgi:hypothetical protein
VNDEDLGISWGKKSGALLPCVTAPEILKYPSTWEQPSRGLSIQCSRTGATNEDMNLAAWLDKLGTRRYEHPRDERNGTEL